MPRQKMNSKPNSFLSHEDARAFSRLSIEKKTEFVVQLSDAEAAQLRYLWDAWARDKQIEPVGKWTLWLILAGRGFGKTRTGAEFTRKRMESGKCARWALVGRTTADVRDVMVEGESGILATSPPWCRPKYEPSKRRLTWPNGAMATTYSADEPDLLRGPQHDGFWADEVAAWQYEDSFDQLMFGLRLGMNPQGVITTTPRPTRLVKRLVKDKTVHVTIGTTFENEENLAPTFFTQVVGRYQHTRLGLQELYAQILADAQGALWKREDMIEQHRVTEYPDLLRIVVGVDPAVADPSSSKSEESADDNAETGIVVAGLAANGHGYVLDDKSLQASPLTWAKEAVTSYKKYRADLILGEKNNGGALVESNIRTVDKHISYKAVWASRGKYTRAEPIASFYEQGRVHHVGMFSHLEDQMCQWEPLTGQKSPDRLDALVWALTELMGETSAAERVGDMQRRVVLDRERKIPPIQPAQRGWPQ
jgi:phage terminase large subunit-like protein